MNTEGISRVLKKSIRDRRWMGLKFFFSAVLLSFQLQSFACAQEGKTYVLPWHKIVEQFDDGSFFCVKAKTRGCELQRFEGESFEKGWREVNYAFKLNEEILISIPGEVKVPRGFEGGEAVISVSRWSEGGWKSVREVRVRVSSGRACIEAGLAQGGFYRLELWMKGGKDAGVIFETYAIVCKGWKRDIISFCYTLIEEIELNRDPKIMFSVMSVSYFENTMNLVQESSFLSSEIIKSLSDAIRSKKTFELGECPDFVKGMNQIRIKRFPGASPATFSVVIPPDYSESRKWPVYVLVKGDSDTFVVPNQVIYLSWGSVTGSNLQWKEFQILLSFMKEKLNIDESRIYINGDYCSGIVTMSLVLHHPDQWAGATITTGNSFRHLAGNALNLPILFTNIHRENEILKAYCDFAVKCFEYYGCRHFEFNKTQDRAQPRGAAIPEWERESNPQRVIYITESLGNQGAYWVRIEGREDENLTGCIDASVCGQSIVVKTTNVNSYSLDLLQAPVDSNRPVEIIEEGTSSGFVTGEVFRKEPESHANARYVKDAVLHGPVSDVFTEPYVTVYGTGGGQEFVDASRELAQSLSNGAPCFADTNMPAGVVDNHNLVIVGTSKTNL